MIRTSPSATSTRWDKARRWLRRRPPPGRRMRSRAVAGGCGKAGQHSWCDGSLAGLIQQGLRAGLLGAFLIADGREAVDAVLEACAVQIGHARLNRVMEAFQVQLGLGYRYRVGPVAGHPPARQIMDGRPAAKGPGMTQKGFELFRGSGGPLVKGAGRGLRHLSKGSLRSSRTIFAVARPRVCGEEDDRCRRPYDLPPFPRCPSTDLRWLVPRPTGEAVIRLNYWTSQGNSDRPCVIWALHNVSR